MKLITTLTAIALFGSATAMAAASTPAPAAPATITAPAAAAAPATHVAMQDHSKKHCNHEASEKKLAGKDRADFIKSCRAAN